MNKIHKKLIILFVILVLIKVILSLFVLAPSAFSDEYTFLKMSQHFFESFSFSENGVPYKQFSPLYSILISTANLFKDTNIIYFVIKLINSIISSLIIFPIFFLAKKFIEEKHAFIISLFVSVLPVSFSFTPLIMAENLFILLFITTIYFMYNSFSENKLKWDILTGIFIGLSILTKVHGVIFIPTVIFLLCYKLICKEYLQTIKKGALIGFTTLIILLPWLIRNLYTFGLNLNSTTGGYSYVLIANQPLLLIWWVLLNLSYSITSTFIIFPILFFNFLLKQKERIIQIILISIFSFIILTSAQHSVALYSLFGRSRIIGRYIEFLSPLIITFGYIGLTKFDKTKFKKWAIIVGGISLFTVYLLRYTLMPINNLSLSWIGSIYYITFNFFNIKLMPYLVVSMILISLIYLVYSLKEIRYKNLIKYLIIFIIIIFLNLAIISYNANTFWYKEDVMQLGIWFNEYDKGKSNVLFDVEDECDIVKGNNCLYQSFESGEISSVPGFWMKNKIIIGDPKKEKNVDYIFSTKELNLDKIKSIGKFKIYKTEGI